MLDEQSDYMKYRGKCKEACEALVVKNPNMKMVRGHYYDCMWDKSEQHWWCVDENNVIHDPTKDQFPTKGMGEYTEFSGFVDCVICGKTITESEIDGHSTGRHIYCSYDCYGLDIM